MEVYTVQLILAGALCASGYSVVTVYPDTEMTISGRTPGSASVTYKVYALTASYNHAANVIPTEEKFQKVDQIGTNPTFVEDKTTQELLCFGFHADSCKTFRTAAYNYRQYSIGFDELIYTIDMHVNLQDQLQKVRVYYGNYDDAIYKTWVGGVPGNGATIYTLETSLRPLVGVIFDPSDTYGLKFLFSKNTVLGIGEYYTPIFDDVLQTIRTDISQLEKFKQKYAENPMKEVAEKSCAYVKPKYGTDIDSCLFAYMMQYIVIMGEEIQHLKDHQPRNLVNTSDYNAVEYTAQMAQAKEFRGVLNQINIVQGQVVQLAGTTGNYFVKAANFDRSVAEEDRKFLHSELKRLQDGTAELVPDLSERLNRLLQNAVILTGLDLADLMIRLAVAVGENLNPLKHLFGGTDLSTMYELMNDIADAARRFGQSVRLLVQADLFSKSAYKIGTGFATNNINIARLERIVRLPTDPNDQQLNDFATNYISKYGGYSPSVTHQDIIEMVELLATVVDKACELYYDSGGLVTGGVGTVLDQKEDCIYLPGMVENLMSYYDETFEFQFTLIDALTGIVRGTIAQGLANKFNEIVGENEFDIKLAALGTAMLEIKMQQIVRKHCDWLEYRYGGKRISDCSTFFFDSSIIDKIIAKDEGDLNINIEDKYAYLPTVKPEEEGYPYINLTKLITTGQATFRLPRELEHQQFLVDNFWLPGNYREPGSNYNYETSYFIKVIEAYIPGLQCKDMSDVDKRWIEIEMMSGEVNHLFPEEAPPSYLLPPGFFTFKYDREAGCPGTTKNFRVKYGSISTTHNLCVRSDGTYHGKFDKLVPSIYAPWTMVVGKHRDCTLAHPRDILGVDPMVTFRLSVKEVRITGIDECWPRGTRCINNQQCINHILSYTC